MTSTGDVRAAAGKVADDYVDEADRDGNLVNRLVSDETFGTLAHSHHDLDILQRYGDDESEALDTAIDEAKATVETALEVRADEILEDSR